MATLSPVSATPEQSRSHVTLARRSLVAFFPLAYLWTWGLLGIAVLGVTAGVLAERLQPQPVQPGGTHDAL